MLQEDMNTTVYVEGLNCVIYLRGKMMPTLNINGEVGITLGIKVESNSRQKEQHKTKA